MVNGEVVASGREGVNDHHRVFDVQLKVGKNFIQVTGTSKEGVQLEDKMEWVLTEN